MHVDIAYRSDVRLVFANDVEKLSKLMSLDR